MNVYQALLRDGAAKRAAAEQATDPAQQITIPRSLLDQLVGALEGVEALVGHQYTGKRGALNALQHAVDDAQEALTAGRAALANAGTIEAIRIGGCP